MSRVGETGVGETGIGETGVGEMGVGEMGTNLIFTIRGLVTHRADYIFLFILWDQ